MLKSFNKNCVCGNFVSTRTAFHTDRCEDCTETDIKKKRKHSAVCLLEDAIISAAPLKETSIYPFLLKAPRVERKRQAKDN